MWGVRQGSVLSPMLFLLVMNSLLVTLTEEQAGVSIQGIYTVMLMTYEVLHLVCHPLKTGWHYPVFHAWWLSNSKPRKAWTGCNVKCSETTWMYSICSPEINIFLCNSYMFRVCLVSPKVAIDFNINKARRAFLDWGLWGFIMENRIHWHLVSCYIVKME